MHKYLRIFLFCVFAVCLLCGCATIPAGENIATYSIGGVSYYSLAALCNLYNVDMQFDTFLRTVVLSKDVMHVSLRVGDALVLVNNNIKQLNYPVDIYQGAIVVPRQFKEQVFDLLFKTPVLEYRRFAVGKIKLRKVVIDAGHGGNDPGAIGRGGLREKDVNLDVAKRLSVLLQAAGVETILTRSSDRFVPLSIRVDIANKSGADLFISIHSNANPSRSLNGFEVYYVATSVSDSERAMLTARKSSLNLKNAVFASNALDLRTIVWDMIYTNSRAESIGLSHSICKTVDSRIDCNILGVKSARYQVLKGVRMPGVLIEIGFLSNSSEERLLKTSVYRQKIAEGILEGVSDYTKNMALVEAGN